jgi:molybdopterin-guanine dinucleotide biosynthesis protein B
MKIYRICGYGSGRSALVIKLVEEFAFRGIRTAVIKHAHKAFDMDKQGSDTWNLRASGCPQTLIAHRERWGLLCETPEASEPDPLRLARHFAPCDLVLAVGFDAAPIVGLEVRRTEDAGETLYRRDARIHAVVGDGANAAEVAFSFSREHTEGIATHILEYAETLPD